MRKSLTDILKSGSRDDLARQWAETEAATEHEPLPAGTYTCRIVSGELCASAKNCTPAYKLGFKVLEGEHAGRQCWHDVWLTPAALAMAKRDLGKLGVTALDQLERPLPQGIRCAVKLALRTTDEGDSFNRVRSFEVVGVDEPERDAFAPADGTPETADGKGGATW